MDELFENTENLNVPFETFRGNWKAVLPHWHYFTELIYVVSGELHAESDNKEFIIHKGDIAIFNPKHIHGFLDYEDKEDSEPLLFYVIKFDNIILSKASTFSYKVPSLITMENFEGKPEAVNLIKECDIENDKLKNYFETCIIENENKEFGYDIKIASIISLIITDLARILIKKGYKFAKAKGCDQFDSEDFSLLEYIDEHSCENINVKDLANKCKMCYSNFSKQFKKNFGRTCKEYIEFVRICKADTLLLYTNHTLDYICQETGFTDASHFIRVYKKFRGITPTQRRINSLH